MFENLVVIGRMNERIALLRAEVERRGMRWADAEVEDAQDKNMTDVEGRLVNGNGHGSAAGSETAAGTATQGSVQSGRLTDEELMARLQERLGEQDDEEGVHL